MLIDPNDTSYGTFCEMIGAYRTFYVIQEAVRSGIIDLLDRNEGYTGDDIINLTGFKQEEGHRFLTLLESAGLLVTSNNHWYLSQFSKTYLSESSFCSQRNSLAFEPLLMENWRQLGTILQEGQGALIKEQEQDQYLERLQLFHRAMAEAAKIRSQELWDAIAPLPEQGTILDVGAGDGTYLREFLKRHPQWHGILCDLPDVCEKVTAQPSLEKLTLFPCNLLNQQDLDALVKSYQGVVGIVLLSNLYHCYAPGQNLTLLQQIARLLDHNGLLIVHDFFRDANSFGALYDLHMLTNTLSGRTYSITETGDLLANAGLSHTMTLQLPSYSVALLARYPADHT